MRVKNIFLLLLILCLPTWSDVYVPPEEKATWAAEWLANKLYPVPEDQRVQAVQDLLQKLPEERQNLEMKIAQAEATPYPGSYMLHRGFDTIDEHEIVMVLWLKGQGVTPPARPSYVPPSSKRVLVPIWDDLLSSWERYDIPARVSEALKQKSLKAAPPNSDPSSNTKHQPTKDSNPADEQSTTPKDSSSAAPPYPTSLNIAGICLVMGCLLGLRRFLATS